MFTLKQVEKRLYPTIVIIKIKIVIAWSWKKISCSIKGEAAFWNPSAAHVAISKGINYSCLKLKFTALVCHIRS
jgi:hypothetical protein